MAKHQPPKDGLVRASRPSLEIRAAGEGKMPKLTGYAARFDEWTDIDSLFEGHFKEKLARGAFKKTLKENPNLRIIFNHGHDPHVGEKPLAEPRFVEDDEGLRYDEPELFDASYVRDLLPALERDQFGSSFKFRVTKESFDEEPERSDENPDGIPERTLEEVQLYEAGPVVFPAYAGATAGAARSVSLTDRMFVDRAKVDPSKVPELVELFTDWVRADPDRIRGLLDDEDKPEEGKGTSTEGAEGTHSAEQDGADQASENDDQDGAERAHSEDGSPATTPMSMDSEDRDGRWFEDESEKEWDLP